MPSAAGSISINAARGPLLIRGELHCSNCGSTYLRRLRRRGFMQRLVFSTFGYYPWECGQCKEPFLIKKRRSRRRHSPPPSETPEPHL